MSDNGYDNVELNEIINDLKNVASKNSTSKNDTRIMFQYSNASRDCRKKPDGPSIMTTNPTVTKEVESISREQKIISCEPIKTSSQIKLPHSDVDTLQKELSMVKKELAILKRSHSLAGHPIFGENVSDSRNTSYYKENLDLNSNVYSNSGTASSNVTHKKFGSSNIAQNNFSSISNIAYQSQSPSKYQYQSLTRLSAPLTYSAHRENAEKTRQVSKTCNLRPFQTMPKNIENYYEDTEDITIQPIGKGIQTLTSSLSSLSKNNNFYNDSMSNVDPMSTISSQSHFDVMKSVKSSKSFWLKLTASREECKQILSNKDKGSFIIRIQSECNIQITGGMIFELILKVIDYPAYYDDNYEYFSLKEFIETTPKGIKLIGHGIEPVFPSLDSFVLQHLEIPLGLPCCLKLPQISISKGSFKGSFKGSKNNLRPKLSLPFNIISKKLSGSLTSLSSVKSQYTVTTYAQPIQAKLNVELLFLGKVTVDRLTGLNAIRHAVDKTLINGYQPKNCIEVNAFFDSLSGISIVDNERILFYKKFLPAGSILYCDVDPLHRGLKSDYLNAKEIKNAKIFGILYQKKKILIKENKVIVFAEFDFETPMENIMKFVKNHLLKQNVF